MDQQQARETVVGVFPDRPSAERAIDDLKAVGFTNEQIGLLAPHGEPGVDVNPAPEYETHASSGAAAGAVIGGVLGAAAALLIPGIGPVVAGGILAAALGGAAVGVVAGGIVGALVGMGIPEEEARYYEEEFKAGRPLVTVRAGDRWSEARDVLRRDGAYDVHQQQPEPMTPYENAPPPVGDLAPAGAAIPMPPPAPTPVASSHPTPPRPVSSPAPGAPTPVEGQEIRVPVVEEQLVARTRAEQVGEVVVEKKVVSEQRTIDVPVEHDEVVVEREPADRPLRPGDQPFREQTYRVPVTEEEVSAQKHARVVGEVVVEKEQVTENQPVSGTVRREEVNVERTRLPNQSATGGVPTGQVPSGAAAGPLALRPWNEVRPTYQSSWQQRFGDSGRRWEDAEPGYQFGYNSVANPRFAGRPFATAEPDLRREWESRGNTTPWEVVREYVVVVWDDRARAA